MPKSGIEHVAKHIVRAAAKAAMKKRRKAAIEKMKREEGIMPYKKEKTFDKADAKADKVLTMEQWAAQKPVRKLEESKKDFGKRHRAWLKRKPKI